MRSQAFEPSWIDELSAGGPWTAERLQRFASSTVGTQVIVVSCREPYSHHRSTQGVRVSSAVSGVVTALEPVVKACGGTWVAYGSGSADAEFVDGRGLCAVPPGQPAYALKRVWLSAAEKRGFLDGFANACLWPLCHRSDVEPVFEAASWQHYQQVNARFCDAVLAVAEVADPLVLVQDYHFALLPGLIRARLPRATVVSFWHIPWPQHAQLATCPWWVELVHGLMGSSIVGLQTAQDRDHFSAAVDVVRQRTRHTRTRAAPVIAPYPISVAWPTACELQRMPRAAACALRVRQENALPPQTRLIVGVDRFDYTKGLIEKLLAFERLLTQQPRWRGEVSLVQVVAPTRSKVPAYTRYQQRVRHEVARINHTLSTGGPPPIVLLEAQHDRAAVCQLYRAAAVCAGTRLHDGMTLVSKDFVSVRDDEHGVLVISKFAGAAEELKDAALVIDPRDTDALAQAFARALEMPGCEQRRRMVQLRRTVRDANVYRWAGAMLGDATALRALSPETSPAHWPELV